MHRALFLIAFCSWSGNAGAAVIYEQAHDSSGKLLQSSWWDPDGSDYDQYVWDSFTLGYDQVITEVKWRGGFDPTHFGMGGPVIDFSVAIYPSIPGGSEPVVVQPPLVRYFTQGDAGQTPAGTFGGTVMYDYDFALPTAFHAVAGTKYWLQIEAYQHGIPDWGLATGTGGDGGYFRRIAGVGDFIYQRVSGDSAFSLLGLEGPTFTVTTSSSPADGGTTTGGGPSPAGSLVTVVATPNPGFGFVDWTEGGATVATSASYSFTLTSDRALVANFVPAYSISTSASPIYGGTTSGDGVYNGGSMVTVAAVAGMGYRFASWLEGGSPVSDLASYSFTAGADRALVASFELDVNCVVFDFDSAVPALAPGQSLPLDQTSGGLTAHFSSSPLGPDRYSIQSDRITFFHLPQFVDNYLYPSDIFSPKLDIQFSRPLIRLAFTFATFDTQVEVPSTIRLTAYLGSTATAPVGTATAHGTYGGSSYPQGTLTFDSGGLPFDVVQIDIPFAPEAAPALMADNFRVTMVPATAGRQIPGDLNQDQALDISDPIRLLFSLFAGDPAALPCEGGSPSSPGPGDLAIADVNGDGWIDVSDAVSALNFLFLDGPPPVLGLICLPISGCAERCAP